MSEKNISTASQQWASRPDDQRFVTLADLKASVQSRRDQSWTAKTPVTDLRVVPADGSFVLDVEDPTAGVRRQLHPTNWAFNQIAQYAQAPAKYLRELDPTLAAINLQWGLEHRPLRDNGLVLAQSNGDHMLRAITSETYGRIWDSQVVDAVEAVNADGRWQIPAASYATQNPKRATTLYASDRDVFIFLVDPNNPIEVAGETLFRGFFTWNSEVGAQTFGLSTFLYRYICDNRTIWGATDVKELRIVHRGGAPDRFAYEGQKFLQRYADESPAQLITQIKAAKDKAIPVGKDETVAQWLASRGFSKMQAERSVEAAKAEEGEARSVWDVINGVTAYARTIAHTDERVALETQAGKMMQLVA